MATITHDPVEAAVAAPAAEYVTRTVGPLRCRFAAVRTTDPDRPIPTVESLAIDAGQFHGSHVDWPYDRNDKAATRKAALAPKATRGAAQSAVKVAHLRDTKGQPHTQAKLAPLVTLVRKAFVARLRAQYKRDDATDRQSAILNAKAERERTAAADKKRREREKRRVSEIGTAAKLARCAVLPDGCKPSKAASRDETRPDLCGGHLSRNGAGVWELAVSDSYQVCVFPLALQGDPKLKDCMIDVEALKAIEKAGAFRLDKQQVVPLTFTWVDKWVHENGTSFGSNSWQVKLPQVTEAGTTRYQTIDRPPLRVNDTGRKDKPRKGQKGAFTLRPEPAKTNRMELTFDAARMATVAGALGGKTGVVTIAFDAGCFSRGDDGVRRWALKSKPGEPTIRVAARAAANGVRGHLMPVNPTSR